MGTLQSAVCAGAIAVACASAAPGYAQKGQKFPTKPVRIVVGFSAGSATDQSARLLAPKLSEMWGQSIVIENRPGGGSTLASAQVAKATPDGHTLLMVSASFSITAVLQQKTLTYDPIKDFRGVTQIGSTNAALVAAPQLGVKTVQELIALAKERPGKIVYASTGAGSGIHLTTERFNMLAGIKVVHVAFKGQPEMIVELLAGRVHYGTPGLGPAMTFFKEGRLVPLAVLSRKRSPLLPEVPAMVEILPNFERDASHALLAPAGTPRPILQQISRDVARVLDMPDIKQRLDNIGFETSPTTPEELDKIIRNQIELFTSVSKAVGLIK